MHRWSKEEMEEMEIKEREPPRVLLVEDEQGAPAV
jgi:hypothetical protein